MAIYDRDLEIQKVRLAKQGQFQDALNAFGQFMNQRQELQQNSPYKQALANQANAMTSYYQSGGKNQLVPLISGYDPQTGAPVISGMVPRGTMFDPSLKAKSSPSLSKVKDERISGLIQMAEENPSKIRNLSSAEQFLNSLPKAFQGRSGAIAFKALQEADPTNPLLGQWQNLKSLLTEAQLDYVKNTKGAVSDREMQLFGQAVANDDLVSVARMAPQLQKIRNSIMNRQNAAVKSYQEIYGEDPSSFAKFDPMDVVGLNNQPASKMSGLSSQAASILAQRRGKK